MNVLYGLLTPDEGQIFVDGSPVVIRNPKEAIAAGIGMVHQHFMLVEVFTVAENLVLGREGGIGLSMGRARRTVRQLSERYRFDVDPDAVVEDLPVGVQQRVEILKALANDARFLIFDEPTAVLTPQEIDELMDVMRALRDEGKAVVFITHKLREVREIADTITVIRRGAVVGTAGPQRVGGPPGRADGRPRGQPRRRQAAGAAHARAAAAAAGRLGRRRGRARGRGRARPRRARRRDRVRGGGAGQRPERARRRPARHPGRHGGLDHPRRHDDQRPHAEADHRRRPRLRARGPPARRLRRQLHRR